MPKIDKITAQKRINEVHEWILAGEGSTAIKEKIIALDWVKSERQAERIIASARAQWAADSSLNTDEQRVQMVRELQALEKKVKGKQRADVKLMLSIKTEIIKLMGLRKPVKLSLEGNKYAPLQVEHEHQHKHKVDVTALSDEVLRAIVKARINNE